MEPVPIALHFSLDEQLLGTLQVKKSLVVMFFIDSNYKGLFLCSFSKKRVNPSKVSKVGVSFS